MREFQSNLPDLSSPLNSQGGYGNASGEFDLTRSLGRKVKSRKDLSQPRRPLRKDKLPPARESGGEDANERYFGSFSLESKRHVWDLLRKHPLFGREGQSRSNRIENNTRDVLTNDPLRLVNNGGHIVYKTP